VLVIFAAAAACTTRDDSQGTEILSQDRTLAAQLKTDQENRAQRLPDACGVVKLAAQPAAANQRQADELTRKAQDAEMHGDIREAQSMLRRATDLDGTNKSTAYHLGRTSEALGDRDAAMTAYCRYLSLTPTSTESAEARQRVAVLSQPQTRTSAGSVIDSVAAPKQAPVAAAPRVTRERSTVKPRVVASAKVERPVRSTTQPERRASSTGASVVADAPTVSQPATQPAVTEPVTKSTEVSGASGSTTAGGEVVATSNPTASAEPPSTAPRSTSRGPNRAQTAGIGAAAGGLIGAMAGRSVKSAVIGAAAGGLLGAALPGRGTSPIGGSGIVPYARQ